MDEDADEKLIEAMARAAWEDFARRRGITADWQYIDPDVQEDKRHDMRAALAVVRQAEGWHGALVKELVYHQNREFYERGTWEQSNHRDDRAQARMFVHLDAVERLTPIVRAPAAPEAP